MIVAALLVATSCPPRLEPMASTVVAIDGVTVVDSIADLPTRLIHATYSYEVVDGTLDCEGQVEYQNRTTGLRRLKYRQSIPAPAGWKPKQGQDEASGACGDRDRVVVLVTADRLAAGESRTVDLRWSVPLFRRADLNEDGRVDSADQGILFSDWSTDAWRSDLNGDGVVNGEDLGRLQEAWTP